MENIISLIIHTNFETQQITTVTTENKSLVGLTKKVD